MLHQMKDWNSDPNYHQLYQMLKMMDDKIKAMSQSIEENTRLIKEIEAKQKKISEETKTVAAGGTVIVRM